MLDRLEAAHFIPLINQPHRLTVPGGNMLSIRIDNVQEQPQARQPDASPQRRMPFTVTVTALEPTTFLDGPCSLDLPGLGCVSNIWVGRMAALGRPPAGAYFQIIFN